MNTGWSPLLRTVTCFIVGSFHLWYNLSYFGVDGSTVCKNSKYIFVLPPVQDGHRLIKFYLSACLVNIPSKVCLNAADKVHSQVVCYHPAL